MRRLYFLLPEFGIFLPAFWAAVIGLAINYSAYESENYRAGILAVPRGQMEAALTLGMTRWTALRHIILPQALRTVVPSVTNDFIALFKDTAVCSVVAVVELTGQYQRLAVAQPQQIFTFALLAAALYLVMSYPLALLARRFERRPHPAVHWEKPMIEFRGIVKHHGDNCVLDCVVAWEAGERAAIGASGR